MTDPIKLNSLLNKYLVNENSAGPTHDRDDVNFMNPIHAAQKRTPLRAAKMSMYSILAFLVVAFLWSIWAQLDEITRGEAKVIPSSQVKKIAHLEPGIVREIDVAEGDVVEKGQLLMKVDNTVAKTRYEEGLGLYYGAKIASDRLRAQIEGKPFVISKEMQQKAPAIAQREMERYQEAMDKLKNERGIEVNDVEQRKQELKELEGKRDGLASKLKLNMEELQLTEPLLESGAASKIELLRIQKEVIDNKSELQSTETNILKAQAALAQAEDKLKSVSSSSHNQDAQELKENIKILANTQQEIVSGKDILNRTNIVSPVKGIVKEIYVTTIGGVIQAGQPLLEVVPLDDKLIIEAHIMPKDIAFLRPGLPAVVKISAYDYSIYGGLGAKVIEISPDAIQDEKKNEFFKVRLRTDKNHLKDKNGKILPISPGMTASVDILTGKKTVLQYLLKPILRAREVAMTER